MYAPHSFLLNLAICVVAAASGVLFVVSSQSQSHLLYDIASVLQIIGLLGIHMKYMFAGSLLLGGRFLPHTLIVLQGSSSGGSARRRQSPAFL
jgi:hypothetical protein